MAKLKVNDPPLYIPSSGSIMSVKFRMSSGLGNLVRIVLPSDNSERSRRRSRVSAKGYDVLLRFVDIILAFLDSELSGRDLLLLSTFSVGGRLLLLLQYAVSMQSLNVPSGK